MQLTKTKPSFKKGILYSLACLLCSSFSVCLSPIAYADNADLQAPAGIDVTAEVGSPVNDQIVIPINNQRHAAPRRPMLRFTDATLKQAQPAVVTAPEPKQLPIFLGHGSMLSTSFLKSIPYIKGQARHPLPRNLQYLLASSNSGLRIHLIDGVADPYYQVITSQSDATASKIQLRINHHTLQIEANNLLGLRSKQPAELILAVSQLNGMSILGHTALRADNIDQTLLAVYANTDWPVILRGDMAPGYIKDAGHGLLSLRWLKASQLNLSAHNNSQIQLDGKAKFLRATLYQNSYLNGRYLTVDNSYIHATGSSTATVSAANNLHAFAYDHSNILYYQIPEHMSKVTSGAGNILQMVGYDSANNLIEAQ